MSQADYEYYGSMAQTWDLFRGDTSGWEDRSFYLEIIREKGQPVLDVGCGTGRLLLDFMSQGVDIEGVDNSPEMLTICREKADTMKLRPILYENNMVSMKLPRLYQTIIVPSSSFQLVLEPAYAQKTILNLFNHLLPGGNLVMPLCRYGNEMSLWRATGILAGKRQGRKMERSYADGRKACMSLKLNWSIRRIAMKCSKMASSSPPNITSVLLPRVNIPNNRL
jgi:SAM-dependent methyltransferase